MVAPRAASEEEISDADLMSPILESIAEADIHQLLYIEQVKIPHCIGITDDDRAKLKRAAQARFIELNQMRGDVSVPKKNLVTGFRADYSLHTSEATTGTKNDGTKR